MTKTLSMLALALGLVAASPLAARANTGLVGGDEGHGGGPTQPTCNIAPFLLTPAVSCNTAGAASGAYSWQVPFQVVSTATSITPVVTFTGVVPASSDPNQKISARMLVWSSSGTLLCATGTSTLLPGGTSQRVGTSFCTFDPSNGRPEAEFGIGHVSGHAASADPRLTTVIYSF